MKLIFCIFLFVIVFSTPFFSYSQEHPFSKEIAAFKLEDKQHLGTEKPILFIGSSSFRMWDSLQSYFPSYHILNRGFGGSTLSDVIYYADDIIFPYRPKQIVIYCGENDLTAPNVDEAVVFDRFIILFEMIRKRFNDIPILFISIKPSPSRKQYRASVESANASIQYFLSQQKHTGFIDVYHLMLDERGNPKPEIFQSDSLHMNKNGYQIWQRAIAPHLIK